MDLHQQTRDAVGGVDCHVGARIAAIREAQGLTVDGLADRLQVTPQQVEAYEAGRQRVTAARLFAIGEVLSSPISGFFVGLGRATEPVDDGGALGLREIVGAWGSIRPERRPILVELARTLAAETDAAD